MTRPEPNPNPNAEAGPGSRVVAVTPRLRLREFELADVPALQAMHRDPRVRAWLIDDVALDERAVALQFVIQMKSFYRLCEGYGIWPAERRVAAVHGAVPWRFCGWFSLVPIPGRPGDVEIGSRLDPGVWGGNLAFEGGRALLERAFGPLGLGQVYGICHPGNRPVLACLAALGFSSRGEGEFLGAHAHHFAIDAAAWQQTRGQTSRQRMRAALLTVGGGRTERIRHA